MASEREFEKERVVHWIGQEDEELGNQFDEEEEDWNSDQLVRIPVEVPECSYKNCKEPCCTKSDGRFLSLCQFHREKQNAVQRKSDLSRRASIAARRRTPQDLLKDASDIQ